ncbi:YjjG family noncanonical pyrimidine nucleotidase [Zunongwangia sp.]|uniref:YjjG family noncanonical pyrimidine nucleotidase n=1 Tax=Zunongwangia sp. TaxID=1965325 RepID=UPI003AA9CFE6
MKLTNITHVFFDLDHTLWDFDKNSALTFEYIFKKNKLDVELDNFLEIYIPINMKYWENYRKNLIEKEDLRHGRLKDTFNAMSVSVSDEIIDTLSTDYITHLSSFNYLLDGGFEALDYLKSKYKLHIITNGFSEVQHRKMSNANIIEYFDTITSSEEAGVKKPHPAIFELSLKKAGAKPENSVMIGDNYEADILGAEDSGLQTIYFDYYKKYAVNHKRHIDSLSNLSKFL